MTLINYSVIVYTAINGIIVFYRSRRNCGQKSCYRTNCKQQAKNTFFMGVVFSY